MISEQIFHSILYELLSLQNLIAISMILIMYTFEIQDTKEHYDKLIPHFIPTFRTL